MPQLILGFRAISRETLGSVGIFMAWHRIPPGARSSRHSHANFETAVYVLGGRGYAYYEVGLGGYVEARPGNFVYTPADLAHGLGCPAGGEALEYVVARNVLEEVVVTLREAHELPIGLDGETRGARRTPEAERKKRTMEVEARSDEPGLAMPEPAKVPLG